LTLRYQHSKVYSSFVGKGHVPHKQQKYYNCSLLSYYAASSGDLLPTFRDNFWAPSFFGFLTLEDGSR